MEILSILVEGALATGFFGFLVNRTWKWLRRPRLSICFDPDQESESFARRGMRWEDQGLMGIRWDLALRYVAVVANEGNRTAENVEAEIELLERRRGGEREDLAPLFPPDPLVWTGTLSTRVHIAPKDEGGSRRLSIFIAGPIGQDGRSMLFPATLPTVASEVPVTTPFSEGRYRVRVTVRAPGADSDSCEIDVELPSDDYQLILESECPCG